MKDAVIYQVFIDRFAKGGGAVDAERWDEPVFCGGDLAGVRERLDYIERLGATMIWLSPFMQTSAYHGYHTTDFFAVDGRFGTLEELKALCSEAHERSLEVMMDFVPNHCSHKHPYFKEAKEDPDSEYRDWFFFRGEEYLCFLDFAELPKLDLDHPPCRQHVISAALHWLDAGIDHFRLDHAVGPSMEFWRAFRSAIKEEHPDALLIGEAAVFGVPLKTLWECRETLNVPRKHWLLLKRLLGGEVAEDVMLSYTDVLDGTLDFTFRDLLAEHVAKNDTPADVVQRLLDEHYGRYPDDFLLPSFLDNHDLDRFLYLAGGDKQRLKRAADTQFSQDQPAIIYYGTEAGLSQERAIDWETPYADLEARRPMPWGDLDEELVAHFRTLAKNRNS